MKKIIFLTLVTFKFSIYSMDQSINDDQELLYPDYTSSFLPQKPQKQKEIEKEVYLKREVVSYPNLIEQKKEPEEIIITELDTKKEEKNNNQINLKKLFMVFSGSALITYLCFKLSDKYYQKNNR